MKPEDFPEGHPARLQIEAALATGERQRETNLAAHEAKAGIRKIVNRPEEELQKELIRTAKGWPMQTLVDRDWPELIYKGVLSDWLYHIPNGGHRSAVEASIFKAMGVMPGVWDLFLMLPTTQFAGLYMELKAGDNDLTDKQQEFLAKAITAGYLAVEVRTGREFSVAVEGYLKGAKPMGFTE